MRVHSGNGLHEEMDRRAVACFDQALEDVGLNTSQPVRRVLHDYFAWATTTTMSRYPESATDVPDGLSISTVVMGRTTALRLAPVRRPS